MIHRHPIHRPLAAGLIIVACLAGCRDSSPPAESGVPAPATSSGRTPSASENDSARLASLQPDQTGGSSETYLGSRSCRPCHADFYEKWSTSHHGLAMQPYDKDLANRRLQPQVDPITVGDYSYRMDVETGAVEETDREGETKTLPVAHVMGGKNVFYLLTPFERGRLQVLPVAYDVRRKQWYDTTDSMVRHFPDVEDEAVHWTDPLLTFNRSCYSCHVSQLAKNYDLETDSYKTQWGEPGINCETCHGPGQEHVVAMEEGLAGDDVFIIRTGEFTPAQTNAMCGSCHAKAYPITASFEPGDEFFDHYNLTTFEDRDWYPDGRDLGENFTMTLWRASPCVTGGELHCQSCHTSSGRDRNVGDPNQACVTCHEAYRDSAAAVAHSHHEADSAGNWCISCHMPETEFARMRRHDHSMMPPAPAASIEFGSPNACNLCHKDQSAEWSDQYVREWYDRDYQAPLLYRARLIDAARKQDWSRLPEMLTYISDPRRNEVFANSLIRLLETCDDSSKWPVILDAMNDPSPLIRSTAATSLGGYGDPKAVKALRKATIDKVRLVRIQAAAALARLGLEPEDDAQRKATDEYVASLRARPDQPGSWYNLGNFNYSREELDKAVAMFETALRLDPNQLMSLVNIAMAYARLDRMDDAEKSLRRALEIAPENAAANFNYGLLMSEEQRFDAAAKALRTAVKNADQDSRLAAQAAYNLAVVLHDHQNQPAQAADAIRKACELDPDIPRYAYTRALYLYQADQDAEAVKVLKDAIGRAPDVVDLRLLLGQIHEERQRFDKALEVYLEAAQLENLDPQTRAYLARRIATIDQR